MAEDKEIKSIGDLPTLNELNDKRVKLIHAFVKTKKSALEIENLISNRWVITRKFIFKNYILIEKIDKSLIDLALASYSLYGVFALSLGILSNKFLGKLTRGKIFEFNRFYRGCIRSTLFLLPACFWCSSLLKSYSRISYYIEEKYYHRVMKFMKTEDPLVINPNFYSENPGFDLNNLNYFR